jgi:catechol 2,3-dioxygenase-like lactoylglutathione lyase family enzyme
MIDHLSVPVSDFERSLAFYKAALAPLGYEVLMQFPGVAGLGVKPKPDLWIGQKQVGHVVHVAIRTDKRSVVDAFYAAAIAAGGKDNGAPGVRPQYHPSYYGAFVLDPDGHNVEAVCHEPYLG